MQSKSASSNLKLQINTSTIQKATQSFTFSSKYLKNMIQAALINILYQRLAFDKSEFLHKEYENVPFVIFKRGSKNAVIRKYHGWAEAIIDAFDKHYLKDIHFFIKSTDGEEIQEHYKFTIKYNLLTETHVSRKDNPALKEDTINVFKTLLALGDYPKLDLDANLKMEFTYYDETPKNYNPPGFRDAKLPICVNLAENSTSMKFISLFKLDTGFHKLNCKANGITFKANAKAQTEEFLTEDLSETDKQNVNHNSMKFTEDECAPKVRDNSLIEEEAATPHNQSPAEQDPDENMNNKENDKENKAPSPVLRSNKRKRHDSYKYTESEVTSEKSVQAYLDCSNISISDISVVDVTPATVVNDMNCICQIKENLNMMTARCTNCHSLVHLACQGHLRQNLAKKNKFVCVICNNTDEMLQQLKSNEEKIELAKLRLLLAATYKFTEIPDYILDKTYKGLSEEQCRSLGLEMQVSGKLKVKKNLITKSVKILFKDY